MRGGPPARSGQRNPISLDPAPAGRLEKPHRLPHPGADDPSDPGHAEQPDRFAGQVVQEQGDVLIEHMASGCPKRCAG